MKENTMDNTKSSMKNKIADFWERRGSILLLAVVLITAPFLLSSYRPSIGDEVKRDGIVLLNGEEIYRVPLHSGTPHQEVTLYPSDDAYVVIEIEGPRIRIKESSDKDYFLVRRGWLQHPGESHVSLHHSLMLKVTSVVEDDN